MNDPAGKEGLAALTARMIASAATQKRSYPDLLDALYPMAASIDANVDREVTVFFGEVHRDNLAAYSALLEEALLTPGFHQDDFDRNREQLLAALTNNLRSNDEALGLELLQQKVFQGHPYGHAPSGTVEGLKRITLDDVKKFYAEQYTRSNLMIGLGGGYPPAKADLERSSPPCRSAPSGCRSSSGPQGRGPPHSGRKARRLWSASTFGFRSHHPGAGTTTTR